VNEQVVPPPNVTGALHIGHGLTGAVEVRDKDFVKDFAMDLPRILCGNGGFIPELCTLYAVLIIWRNL
jgi:hypothetical protein